MNTFGYSDFVGDIRQQRQMTISGPMTEEHVKASDFPYRGAQYTFNVSTPHARAMLSHEIVLHIEKNTGLCPKDIRVVQGFTKRPTVTKYTFRPYYSNNFPHPLVYGPMVYNTNGVYHSGRFIRAYSGKDDQGFRMNEKNKFEDEEGIKQFIAETMKLPLEQICIVYRRSIYIRDYEESDEESD